MENTVLNFDDEIQYLKDLDARSGRDHGDEHQEPVAKMIDEGCPIVGQTEDTMKEAGYDFSKGEKGKYVGKTDVRHFDLMEVRPFLKAAGARLTRKRYAETTVREYLAQIQPVALAEQYLEFYDAHPFYKEVCAGAKHHHWWKGGLEQHVREMIGVGMDLMDLYAGDMVFTKSDVIIVAFLHDFDKIWLYQYLTDEERAKNPKKYREQQVFTYTKGATNIMDGYNLKLLELARAGIVPTNEQWSAVLFHEGGYAAANFDFRGPTSTGDTVSHANLLAPFMHILDMYSAMLLGRSIV